VGPVAPTCGDVDGAAGDVHLHQHILCGDGRLSPLRLHYDRLELPGPPLCYCYLLKLLMPDNCKVMLIHELIYCKRDSTSAAFNSPCHYDAIGVVSSTDDGRSLE
jgi:hypothetical protein